MESWVVVDHGRYQENVVKNCCSCIWQSDKADKPGCELYQMSFHSKQTTTFIKAKKSDEKDIKMTVH